MENLEKGHQKVGHEFALGSGREEHYLLPHSLPEIPATLICHLLGSKHYASPEGTMQTRPLQKKISSKGIKTLALGETLVYTSGP